MSETKVWQRWSQFIFSALLIIFVPLGLYLLYSGATIDTDIKRLSPEAVFDEALQNTINSNAVLAEKRIRVALVSKSEFDIDDASYEYELALESLTEFVAEADPGEAFSEYLALLQSYPRNFMTKSDRLYFEGLSESEMQAYAKQRVYRSGSSFRFTSLKEDPLSFLNEFIVSALDKGSTQNSGQLQSKETTYVELFDLVLQKKLSVLEQADFVARLKELSQQLMLDYPKVTVVHSGIIFFSEEAASGAKRDINLISVGSIFGVVILLLCVFRTLRPIILPIISIGVGVTFALIFCLWVFGNVHIVTIVFGASLIGVVVDYALHYFYFLHTRPENSELVRVYRALLLSLVTSVIGYSALGASGLPALKQVAFFSVVGLVSAWLTVLSLGNLFFRTGDKIYDATLRRALIAWVDWLSRCRGSIVGFLVSIIFLAACGFFYHGISTNDSPRNFFSFSKERLAEEELVSNLSASYEPASFVLVEGESLTELYDNLSQFKTQIESEFEIDGVVLGLDDISPSKDDQQLSFSLQKTKKSADALSAVYEILGLSDEFESISRKYVTEKFEFLPPSKVFDALSGQLPQLYYRDINKHFSILQIPKTFDLEKITELTQSSEYATFVSSVDSAESALTQLRESALFLLSFSYLCIAALIAFRYRDIKKIKIMLVPICSTLVCIVLIQLLGGALNLFHVMALFLVLGLGMDYVIFIEEMSSRSSEALAAITLSSVTSLLSFGLLSLSSTPIVHSFGLVVLVGNTCNLIASFVLEGQNRRASYEIRKV